MNQEEKNTVREEPTAEQQPSSATNEGPPPRRKASRATIAVACAILFVTLYAIVNISVFSNLFTGLLSILAPVILGAAFAYLLNPILKFFEFTVFRRMQNKNVVRGLSLVLTYVVAVLIIVAFLLLLIPQLIQNVSDFIENFDYHLSNTTQVINNFIQWIAGKNHTPFRIEEETLLNAVTKLLNSSGDLLGNLMDYAIEYGTGLFVGLKNLVLAVFISIYLLAAKERLLAQSKKLVTALFSQKGKKRVYRYARLCDRTFGGFFIGKIIDSLIIGVLTLITLLIFRMPYALLVSVIVGVTNVIPFFGPLIGAIPSFLIIFIASPGKAFLFLLLILIIQQLDGNVIGPKILGNTTGISSLGVIISITIMGDLFGIVGMLIGVPLFAVIIALIKEFLDHRLRKKDLPSDTAEYYNEDSLVDPHEVHEPVTARLFRGIGHTFLRIFRPGKSKKKESKKHTFGEDDPDEHQQ